MMIIDILQVNSGIIVAISDEVTKHINSDIHIVHNGHKLEKMTPII